MINRGAAGLMVALAAACGGGSRTPARDARPLPTAREASDGTSPHRVENVAGAHVETLDTGPLTVVVRSPPMRVGTRVSADVELHAHPPYYFLAAAPPRLDLDAPDGIDLTANVVHPARSDKAEGLPKGRAAVYFEIPVLLERAGASGREVDVHAAFILCRESPQPRCEPGTVTLAIPIKAP